MTVRPLLQKTLLAAVAVSALSLGACQSTREAIGLTKVVPNEFVTVASAPLAVPPEYGLRPPNPGEPRPQELAPESAARQILLGQRQAITRTGGEQALVAAAGAERADPLARYVVDDEFGGLAHKEESWANRIMFWRRDDAASQAATTTQTSQGPLVIDPTSEAARLEALTGRQGIVIQPRQGRGIKLPGL